MSEHQREREMRCSEEGESGPDERDCVEQVY